ncbi:MAG: hypothetical protein NT103_08335 [Campylobacterales bacterium]|nr:hypothetical protein [Campylobacterales bacterium]
MPQPQPPLLEQLHPEIPSTSLEQQQSHAVSLILPTGANIVTAAGDTAEFICEHGANQYWRCTGYQRKDGTALYTGYANISTVGSLGQQSGILSASFTLAQSHAGKMQVCTPGITVTLPPINTIASGSCFILKNVGGSPYTPVTIAVNGNGLESVSLKIVPNEILILQSDGGSTYRLVSRTGRTPMYDDSNIAITYNTVYQAATDLTLIAVLAGSYMNGAQLVVGNTSSPTRVLSQFGDDINSNTKEATMTAVIPAGMYYAVQPQGAWAWEITVSITAYPHK